MTSVEIYLVKPGQAIKDGRLVYSSDIHSRADAQADATSRLKTDPGLEKIVYYTVSESGSFKTLYAHTNPNPPKPPPRRHTGNGGGDIPKLKQKPEPKGFWARLKKSLDL